MGKKLTIQSYQFEDTSDANLKRVCDLDGDWTHYYLVKEKKYLPAVNHILGLGFNKGPRFADYLLNTTREESQRKLKTAGEEGTRSHAAIRDLIDGVKVTMSTKYTNEITGRQEMLNMDEWKNLMGFYKFCQDYQPKRVMNEFSIYYKSDEISFAGSPDALLIVTVPDKDRNFPKEAWGKQVLMMPDWKTSSAIHNEYKCQLSAYHRGLVWRKEQILGKGLIKKLQSYGQIFTGIVRIGTKHKCGYEIEAWTESETNDHYYKLFRSAYEIYRDHEPQWHPVIEEIPMQFIIKMPTVKARAAKPKQP